MSSFFVSPNAIMIEVLITPSGGNTVSMTPFNEQQQLLNRPIVAIQAFCNLDMTYSPLSSGVPVIPVALFNAAFIEINRAGNKASSGKAGLYYKRIPLSAMRNMQNNYSGLNPSPSFSRDLFRVKPMYFQWPDSNIVFPTSIAQAAVYSVPLLIHYLLEGEDPTPYNQ